MKKILNKFHQGTVTTVIIIIVFWNISSGISLKLEKKNGATFSNFNPFPSLPASKTAKGYFKNVEEQAIRRQSKVWSNL